MFISACFRRLNVEGGKISQRLRMCSSQPITLRVERKRACSSLNEGVSVCVCFLGLGDLNKLPLLQCNAKYFNLVLL